MTYREYIKLADQYGLTRYNAYSYYMGHGVALFWFDNSKGFCGTDDLLNRTGEVKMVNDEEIVYQSTDAEVIKEKICKRIEEIRATAVDDKLKTMEKDFE